MKALSTGSRLRILDRLRDGAQAVEELATNLEMEQSAISHQLRVLRHLGFVVSERRGRQVFYSLYDAHVAVLLEEALSHLQHVRLGLGGTANAETGS